MISNTQLEIEVYMGRHSGGTKFYNVIVLSRIFENGIRRYAVIGHYGPNTANFATAHMLPRENGGLKKVVLPELTKGQNTVYFATSPARGREAREDLLSKKRKGGYTFDQPTYIRNENALSSTDGELAEFLLELVPNKLVPIYNALQEDLDSDLDLDQIREIISAERVIRATHIKEKDEAEAKEKLKAEVAKHVEIEANLENENWGTW